MKQPLVSIITTTVNTPSLTSACLQSVSENTAVPYELIVVNNSRARPIRERLGNFKNIRVIQNTKNLGYTRAANQGIRASRGKFLCFLNTDALVPAGWMERLLDAAEKPGAGAAGPLTEPNGFRWPAPDPEARRAIAALIDEFVEQRNGNAPRESHLLTGFCLLIPRKVMGRMGLFDERFFFGWEDIDYSLRLRLAGYRLLTVPSLFIHHRQGASAGTKRRRQLVLQSERQFVAKWRWIIRSGCACAGALIQEFNRRLGRIRREAAHPPWAAGSPDRP